MKFKKNLPAKIGALLASVAALLGIWTAVRQNPPATDATAAAVPAATASAAPGSSAAAPRRSATPLAAQPAAKRHTRTRVS